MRDFDAVPAALRAAVPGREAAADRLRATGFPARKDEAWFYTSTRRLLERAFPPAAEGTVVDLELPEGDRLVFVDGRLAASLSSVPVSPPDVVGDVLGEPEGFAAANAACWRDGAKIELTDGQVLHLVHVATGGTGWPRVHVTVSGAAQLVEHWRGQASDSLTVAVTEIALAEGARLDHLILQSLPVGAQHVQMVATRVGGGATYAATSLQAGASLARTELDVQLAGEGAITELSGLALGRGQAHADHHVTVRHQVPHGTSRQSFRCILDDASRAVFTGKVVVAEGAQKTDSTQSNRALLLSDDAVANSRPQLEILADDVVCSHGAAIGQLDDEALFYLRQRGLSVDLARGLLVEAFAGEVVAAVPADLRALAHDTVAGWLEAR